MQLITRCLPCYTQSNGNCLLMWFNQRILCWEKLGQFTRKGLLWFTTNTEHKFRLRRFPFKQRDEIWAYPYTERKLSFHRNWANSWALKALNGKNILWLHICQWHTLQEELTCLLLWKRGKRKRVNMLILLAGYVIGRHAVKSTNVIYCMPNTFRFLKTHWSCWTCLQTICLYWKIVGMKGASGKYKLSQVFKLPSSRDTTA